MLPRERTALTVNLMRTWTNVKSSTLPHPLVEMRPPQPSNLHPLHRAQRLCTELPGMARLGHGWIRESNARHSTMLYSMQVDTPSTDHTAGLMRHGRASREQT